MHQQSVHAKVVAIDVRYDRDPGTQKKGLEPEMAMALGHVCSRPGGRKLSSCQREDSGRQQARGGDVCEGVHPCVLWCAQRAPGVIHDGNGSRRQVCG